MTDTNSHAEREAFALFDALIDLPPAEREARLLDTHADVRARVVRMLDAADADGGAATSTTEKRVARWAAAVAGDGATPQPGDRLGHWQVLSVLGSGGMGAVYLCERDIEDIRQRAAVKLIGVGMDTPAARERFAQERRILARLVHPGIAGLLDAGVTATGVPYFAMACIEGERIDHWCDARTLDARERVQLLTQVLDAVAFAHRQLVVHRDLKPSNILVDENGHAWLLDFGIAKLIEEGDSGHTRTVHGAFTPEYASPEQLNGEPVSTSTDIYQFGVLMYALLAHAHPYGLTGGTSLRTRLQRMDGEPRPLRDVALRMTEKQAKSLRSTPAALSRQLRGDLSAIAHRCLSADPRQRYGSVDALRNDLRAWLDARPVSARTPSLGYLASRFVRRNKIAVGAAAAAVVALCSGLGIALWQTHEARLQAQRADMVNGYLVDVFRSIDPEEGLGPDASVRQLIDSGVARLDRGELRGQPGAEGRLRLTLADSYIALGEYPKAGAEIAHALKLLPASQADDAMEARLRQCEVLLLVEKRDETGRCLDAAEIWRNAHAASLSEPETDAAHLQIKNAQLLGHREQYDDAVPLARTAWERLRKLRGDDDPLTLDARVQYAELLSTGSGKHADAVTHMQAVVDGIRRTRPPNEYKLASALHNLATYQSLAGDGETAAASERQAVAIRRRILPPDHPYIALSIGHLATLLDDMGRNNDALPLHAEATGIYRRQPPGLEVELGRELNNWGVGCYGVGDMECATGKIGDAVATWAKALPAEHANLLAARGNLAALYSRSGRLADGEAQLRQVVTALETKERKSQDAETVSSLSAARNELAANLLSQGHNAEALAISRKRWQDLQTNGDPAKFAASALSMLALAELANNLPEQALTHAQSAAMRAHTATPGGDREAFALMTLARAHLAMNDANAAIAQSRKAVAMFIAALGNDHRDTGLAHGVLARALLASGRRGQAHAEFDAAIATLTAKAAWLPELKELRALRNSHG